MTDSVGEVLARAIFQAAIDEQRCDELLMALFDGGSATVDITGKLIILPRAALEGLR